MLFIEAMHDSARRPRLLPAGFTLVELLVVLALLAVLAGLAFPPINNLLYRSKVRTEVRKTANMMQIARYESIRRGAPAVVEILPPTREVVAFVDIHGENITDPPDGLFNPLAGQPARATDYLLRRFPLGSGLTFADPDGNTGVDAVDGLDNPVPLPDKRVIFEPNGSVSSSGALRLADLRLNYLEVRIAPAATARVQVRKYDESLDINWDGTHWYAEGEVSRGWNWN